MSDRINPQGPRLRAEFRPSYRLEKKRNTLTEMGLFSIVAAGLGAIAALGLGGIKLLNHRHEGVVPTVEAPAGPVRVKPLDAGGLKLTGTELSPGPEGAQALGPAAEQPEINALRAQLQAVKKQLARQAAENAQTAKIAQTAKAEAAAPKIVVTPAPVQASAIAHVAAVPPPVPVSVPPVEQRAHVQLAAFADSAAAYTEWDMLVKKWPDLLARRRPEISRVEVAGRTMWRLRTGPFPDKAEANNFCETVRNRGAECSIASF